MDNNVAPAEMDVDDNSSTSDSSAGQREGGAGSSSNLYCIAAFASTTMALTVAMVSVLIQLLLNQQHQPRSDDMSEQVLIHTRKRRRDDGDNLFVHWRFLNILKSYLIFHREIFNHWYIKPRTVAWFNLYSDFITTDDPKRFKQFFRMSPATFYTICEMVHGDMVTRPPRGLRDLPNRELLVQRQVAIALRRLSTGDQILGIGELFGVSTSTVIKCTWKFIKAINSRCRHEIRWPAALEMEQVKAGFLQKGFPNCCGALDGTHFPLELPVGERSEDYYDWKHNISITTQAIVDCNLRFLDVCTGWPGSVQDSRLLRNSGFYRSVVYQQQNLRGPLYRCANGEDLKENVLADAGYPLFDWLITPYPRGLDVRRDEWNHRHSSARIVVERAFGQLKGTWRILSRVMWKPRVNRVGPMVFCCCILHNLMIRFGEHFNARDVVPPHPRGYGAVLVPAREVFEGGEEARDLLLTEAVPMMPEVVPEVIPVMPEVPRHVQRRLRL